MLLNSKILIIVILLISNLIYLIKLGLILSDLIVIRKWISCLILILLLGRLLRIICSERSLPLILNFALASYIIRIWTMLLNIMLNWFRSLACDYSLACMLALISWCHTFWIIKDLLDALDSNFTGWIFIIKFCHHFIHDLLLIIRNRIWWFIHFMHFVYLFIIVQVHIFILLREVGGSRKKTRHFSLTRFQLISLTLFWLIRNL